MANENLNNGASSGAKPMPAPDLDTQFSFNASGGSTNQDSVNQGGQGTGNVTTHAPGVGYDPENTGGITTNPGSTESSSLREQLLGSFSNERIFLTGFNMRHLVNDHVDFFIKGIPYVFMTCPVLNLCDVNVRSDSFLTYMATSTDENREILSHLTNSQYTDDLYSGINGNNRMIPLVTNTALSIDIKDTVARTKEVGETFYGYKQVHPGSLVDSIVGDEISIKYLELTNLPILKMHKVWQDYIEKVRRGIFLPSASALSDGFIDYMSSIYYILCDFDGTTIKYWARYTGVAPLNVPYSSLGGDFNSHEVPDITINYSYCYKEDMSVAILRDFNRVAAGNGLALDWDDNGTESAPDSIISRSAADSTYPSVVAYSPTNGGYGFRLSFNDEVQSSDATIRNYNFTSTPSSENNATQYNYDFPYSSLNGLGEYV